jgi:hypothetical protein
VDPTSFMRQSETIEATTPEISVARTAVASYFSEVKKALEVGQNAGFPMGQNVGKLRNGGTRWGKSREKWWKTSENWDEQGKMWKKHGETSGKHVGKCGKNWQIKI